MSVPTIAADSLVAGERAAERQTYWCDECDMSVSLLSSSSSSSSSSPSSLLCPYCRSDFLEQLDGPLSPPPPPISNPNDILPPHTFLPPFLSPPPSITSSDDNFLLDSPYLLRLIQPLADSDPAAVSRQHSPASKSAVESIPTVRITAALLEADPISLCAVCKDQFVVDDETKQLPCKHMYHPDCILPWLSQHNSCPVCRFQLPVENGGERRGRRRSRVLRLEDLMENGEELFGIRRTLRLIARRHRVVFPEGMREIREDPLISRTLVAEDEISSLPDMASSVDGESGWASWPLEEVVDGHGDGEIVGGAAMVVNEEGDILTS